MDDEKIVVNPKKKIIRKIKKKKKSSSSSSRTSIKSNEKNEKNEKNEIEEVDIDNMIKLYIESMDDKMRLAYKIAIDSLGSSFDIEKSLGFIKFLNNYKKN
jgi:hypothetical protein